MLKVEPHILASVLAVVFYNTLLFAGGEHNLCTSAIHKSGFEHRIFANGDGQEFRYLLFVPRQRLPSDKLPVLLFLNGTGENGEDGVRQVSNNFGVQVWESRLRFPFIAIAPQCRIGGSWDARSLDTLSAMSILDRTIEEFDADSGRVYLTGVSAGGGGVWSIASAYPNRFAAILPLCGIGGNAQELSAARMPIWIIYNSGDKPELVSANRAIRRQLIERGNSPLVTEYDAGGHDCWNRAYRTTALYGWLLEQSRPINQQAMLFQYFPPERLLSEWQSPEHGSWEAGEQDVIIGRDNGTSRRSELISSGAESALELHGDVWLRDDTECRIGLLAEDPKAESWWISILPPKLGTGGVVDNQGAWLGRLDPASQHTLRTDAWNDVRVQLSDGRIEARLNGWSALDVAIKSDKSDVVPTKYRCALATPENGSDIKWRFIRARFKESLSATQRP